MDQELEELKENTDYHIKKLKRELNDIKIDNRVIEENVSNINYNYELIHELKEEINDIRKEIGYIKLMLTIFLKTLKKREMLNPRNNPITKSNKSL